VILRQSKLKQPPYRSTEAERCTAASQPSDSCSNVVPHSLLAREEVSQLGRKKASPFGTPADKLLKAVRRLAADQFALKHRYALTLRTDEAHPHVHLLVKAMSEQGQRLNIRKATLRNWRQQFAMHLCERGIAANATERAVRGQKRAPKSDAIYRAMQRKDSIRERKEALGLANRSSSALRRHRDCKEKLEQTRSKVVAGWYVLAQRFQEEREYGLADEVRFFVARMSPPQKTRNSWRKRFATKVALVN